MQEFHINQSIS